jgi:GDP-L-fucose synthase
MVVPEEEHSVLDVVKIVIKKFDISPDKIVFDETMPKGQHKKTAKSDVPKDYKFINLEQGINETIDWFIKNYKIARK